MNLENCFVFRYSKFEFKTRNLKRGGFIKALKFLAIALLIGFTLTGQLCKKKTETTATPTPTSTSPTSPAINLTNTDATNLDLKGKFETAKLKAQEWKRDAALYLFSVEMPPTLELNNANQIFIFGSASDIKNWYTFTISEATEKFVRAIIPKEDYLGADVKLMDQKFWKINYVQAFQIAEENGGADYRAKNKLNKIIATLSNSEPKGWLWWVVTYQPANGGTAFSVRINAGDSSVVDENGNIITAAKTATPAATASPQ